VSAFIGYITLRAAKESRGFFYAAGALFVVGVLSSYWAFAGTTRARSNPSVNATLRTSAHGDAELDAEVLANGLAAHQYVRVRIMATHAADLSDARSVYVATQGADTDGNVDAKVALSVPIGYQWLLVKVWQSSKEPQCRVIDRGLPKNQYKIAAYACLAVAVAPGAR
jgi:hypothetical protein